GTALGNGRFSSRQLVRETFALLNQQIRAGQKISLNPQQKFIADAIEQELNWRGINPYRVPTARLLEALAEVELSSVGAFGTSVISTIAHSLVARFRIAPSATAIPNMEWFLRAAIGPEDLRRYLETGARKTDTEIDNILKAATNAKANIQA